MTHMETGVTADYISDLHHWIKLYFNVHYLCIIAYITSDTEKSENSYRKSEHKETNAHWRIFLHLLCKMYKSSLYFWKRKYCENISIDCV